VLAHGKATARHRAAARQRLRARQREGRTAISPRTAKRSPHGKEVHARQGQGRTAKAFAVHNGHAHGNIGFAGGLFAEQRLCRACRAYKGLCHAKWSTATPCYLVVLGELDIDNFYGLT
jgi:hypothetical protein